MLKWFERVLNNVEYELTIKLCQSKWEIEERDEASAVDAIDEKENVSVSERTLDITADESNHRFSTKNSTFIWVTRQSQINSIYRKKKSRLIHLKNPLSKMSYYTSVSSSSNRGIR